MSQTEGSQSCITDYNSAVDPVEYLVNETAFTYYWCATKVGIQSRVVEKIRPFFTGQSETRE